MREDGADVTTIETIAEWAAQLSIDDVPPAVRELLRAQRRSVLAATAASEADPAANKVLDAVEGWAGPGDAPLVGRGRKVDVESALYGATALSVALDFDDYMCFGHTGHSAVLVPLLVASETNSEGSEQVVAQAIANEVEARLGGSTLIGPMNGQLCAFIQGAGTALAAGRLMGLDSRQLAHALAITLAHPPRGTMPGFMAPDSKLLVAAEPVAAGLRAARLAAQGFTGPLDAVEDERGALAALTYAPVRDILSGWGEGWTTLTLCVKPYPGCAYIDTTVDALLEIIADGAPEPADIDEVVVEAGMVTTGMDALSAPYADLDPPTPVTINFNISWNAAIVLRSGRLTQEETHPDWLAEHRDELRSLRERVRLVHDPELTAQSAAAFGRLLPLGALRRELGLPRLLSSARQVRAEHPSAGWSVGDVAGLVRSALTSRQETLSTARHRRWWDPDVLADFAMTFPARVTLRTRDGEERRAEVAVPRGGAGNAEATPDAVAREKLATCGPLLWGDDGTAAIDAVIESDEAKLHELVAHDIGRDSR